jgi:hypothetical protein
MNLKEEITNEMSNAAIWSMAGCKITSDNFELLTNNILKLFENRILEERIDLLDKSITNLDIACGWNNALEQLKWKIKNE